MAGKRSREALLGFLDYLGQKGLMNATTARSRKASVNGVLGILSEEEADDVSTLDLDELMHRFSNLQGSKFTPESLQTYKSRVKASIEDFLRYLDNPLTFRANTPTGTRKARDKSAPAKATAKSSTAPVQAPQPPASRHTAADSILPIPVRADLIVYVQGLPFDLTTAEANKIANVIKAMAATDVFE